LRWRKKSMSMSLAPADERQREVVTLPGGGRSVFSAAARAEI
jgi:hypothetical protein